MPHFDKASIETVFGRFSEGHFLAVQPLDWGFQLTETQATRGLCRFLTSGSRRLRGLRMEAFLAALGTPMSSGVEYCLESASVEAECPAGPRRIDIALALPARHSRFKRAVLIEAKFGHRITAGQLPHYKAFAARKQFVGGASDPAMRADLVVLGLASEGAGVNLLWRNRRWRFVSWADLLLRLQRSLPPEADDDSFRLFRRTLWSRIGGLASGRST